MLVTSATVRRRSLGAMRPTNSRADSEPASTPSPRSPRRAAPHPHALGLRPADRIGEFWGYPQSRAFAELLIDCEEDRTLRTVLVGMLRESDS
jgi:hypothetical protein